MSKKNINLNTLVMCFLFVGNLYQYWQRGSNLSLLACSLALAGSIIAFVRSALFKEAE